jgi:hypothetical protein
MYLLQVLTASKQCTSQASKQSKKQSKSKLNLEQLSVEEGQRKGL